MTMNIYAKESKNLINHKSSMSELISISELVCWRLDDVINLNSSFDFNKLFLPDAFFPLSQFDFLSVEKRISYNHILSHSYLNIFELSEEFIIGMTLKLAEQNMHKDRYALRAISRFTEEEVKHQQMFQRGKTLIQDSFAFNLNVLGNYTEISDFVLGHSDMATLLLIIHLELITQAHYTDSVKERGDLDPLFCNILKNHWIEECQHVKIDIVEFNRIAQHASPQELDDVYQEYQVMVLALAQMLHQQAQMNVADLNLVDEKELTEEQKKSIITFTHESYCNGLLKYGFANAHFQRVMDDIFGDSKVKFSQLSTKIDQQILSLNQ